MGVIITGVILLMVIEVVQLQAYVDSATLETHASWTPQSRWAIISVWGLTLDVVYGLQILTSKVSPHAKGTNFFYNGRRPIA